MTKAVYPVISTQNRLPFYLTGIGISDPEYHVKREKGLLSHQFLFTSSGSGMLYVNGKEYPQQKGSIFYLAPGKEHEYYPIEGNWVTNWIVFRGECASELMKNMGFGEFHYSNEFDFESCARIFKRIFSAASDPVDGGENASVLIYEFVLAARRSMLFAGHAGSTINKIAAKALLVNTDMEIGEIGRKVGYADRNYFSIVFRRIEGISPREYRRSKGTVLLPT